MTEHQLVHGFGVSREWVEETMSKEFNVTAKVSTVEVLSVCGYMSAIVRVHLNWTSNSIDLPATVVAKIPSSSAAEEAWKKSGMDDDNQAQDPIYEHMHKMEIQAYSLFKEAPSEELRVPRLYGYRTMDLHPVLLIQDFRNSFHVDLIDGFSDEQLYAIMDQIVALHKWAKKNEQIWKSLKFEMEFDPNGELFCSSILKMMDLLVKEEPKLTHFIDLLRRNFANNTSWMKKELDRFMTDGTSTFIHGDLWAPQILWNEKELVAIVDWALCRPGPRTEDILRILTTCCSTETRKRMTLPLLEYYVKKMDGEVTLTEVKEDYKNTLPWSCTMMSFAVCMWSNSPVLRHGKGDDEERVKIMRERLMSTIEDTAAIYGWK